MSNIILTTTNGIEGHRIVSYLGIAVGEAVLGVNIFKDMFAGIRDVIGGRSGTYEEELAKARELALGELEARGQELGANAIVAIDLDYEVIGMSKGNMMLVSASGTAVVVQ